MIVTGTSRAEKIVAYSMPMTPAPTTVRLARHVRLGAMLSLSKTLASLKGISLRPEWRGADGDHDLVAAKLLLASALV